ncbi:hypothetical protein QWZ03_09730 [Chitinimonas viridis]|uniref:GNAT family N-acetyltransferase n=1 Tax=Chitinimonas viridis TaxID=664880 RepID=A0ABT8B466_9NEIS|nr:hypothetical protein [Chitinimonas viridis]MDN3577044.1 hypothetical protein [Chitinimonas viridis]
MLSCRLHDVAALDDATRDQMYALLARHYAATDRQRFEEDLAAKQWVLLLTDAQAQLQGFSTLHVYAVSHQDRDCRIVYSGDTVIDRAHWGEQGLAFNWLRLAGQLRSQAPQASWYWFLISKGHRTYRYLPAFARCFYPHWQHPTPAFEASLLHRLAQDRFGAHYQAEQGIVRFPQSQGHLQDDLARVNPREQHHPAVRFFLERNPGYAQGHELCCLCELAPDNLRPLAQRLLHKGASNPCQA